MGSIIGEGITFDDVLLVPAYSEVIPNQVELSTCLTKTIKLNIPLMSAGMDTVTEHRMAIAMARQGGIGIIHKNMSIEQQAEEVDKVKRSENGVITDPFSLSPEHTLKDADELMGKFRISGVPITEGKKLVGIITNRDLKFEEDFSRKIKECMTSEHLVTAREGITMQEAKQILAKARVEKLPIVDGEFNLKGLITIKDIEKQIKYPLSAKDKQGRLLCGAGVGITANVLDRVKELIAAKVDVVVLDSAHGHSENVLKCLRMIKEKYPDLQVIAGNVATGAGTKALIEAGAASNGTMVYSLSETGEYTPAIPTGKAVGTYTVWYKAQGDNNHNDSEAQSVTASIIVNNVTPPTIKITPEKATFNGEKQEPTVTVTDDNGFVIDGSEYTATCTTDLTSVGTHTLTITGTGTHYDFTATADFEILPAGQTPLTITGTRERV